MPDPISIISVTALALSAAKTTKNFIDGIVDAPHAVTATTRDLESLNTILTLLLTQLQDPVFEDVQALDPIVAMLDAPLKNCTEEMEKLQNVMKPLIKPSGAAKTGKWARFTFKFREADVVTIQQRLSNYRASLDAAVGIAVLIISARSSKNVQMAGVGIDNLQRRIQRLLLHAGLDNSTASTSSYAASEILESADDSRIMDWLHEAGTNADDDEAEDKDPALWSPEIVIGIDVGTTCTGVAYSLAPDFSRPIMFTQWPSHEGEPSDEKVRTVVYYDRQHGTLLDFGFDWESHLNKDVIEQGRFLCFMNPEFKNRPEDAPSAAQSQTFYKDFLSCIYGHLSRRLRSVLPGWNERGIEFIFSTPNYCTSPNLRRDLEELIKSAGFGAQKKHHVSIVLTEQAILATVPLPKIPIPGTVLICDAGDVEWHASVCTTSTQAGILLLDILTSTTRQPMASESIDYGAKETMNQQWNSLKGNPDASGILEENLLLYGREVLERHRREWDTFKRSYSLKMVTGADFIFKLADLDLRLTSEEVHLLFFKQIVYLGILIQDNIDSARAEHGLKVDSIVLSGGLGASPYIQWFILQVIQRYLGGNVQVIVDAEAYTAATRGLVIHRLRELRLGQNDQ